MFHGEASPRPPTPPLGQPVACPWHPWCLFRYLSLKSVENCRSNTRSHSIEKDTAKTKNNADVSDLWLKPKKCLEWNPPLDPDIWTSFPYRNELVLLGTCVSQEIWEYDDGHGIQIRPKMRNKSSFWPFSSHSWGFLHNVPIQSFGPNHPCWQRTEKVRVFNRQPRWNWRWSPAEFSGESKQHILCECVCVMCVYIYIITHTICKYTSDSCHLWIVFFCFRGHGTSWIICTSTEGIRISLWNCSTSWEIPSATVGDGSNGLASC